MSLPDSICFESLTEALVITTSWRISAIFPECKGLRRNALIMFWLKGIKTCAEYSSFVLTKALKSTIWISLFLKSFYKILKRNLIFSLLRMLLILHFPYIKIWKHVSILDYLLCVLALSWLLADHHRCNSL